MNLHDALETLPPGGSVCDHGHDYTEVDVCMSLGLPDTPPFPKRLAWDADRVMVYDQTRYAEVAPQPGYCHAADGVSWTVLNLGIWEPFETLLMADVLERGRRQPAVDRGIVVDVGSHFGWFSVLGAAFGYQVVAVEYDGESAQLTDYNLHRATPPGGPEASVHWREIPADPTPLPVDADEMPPIRYLKIDVEGRDPEAVVTFSPFFEAGLVDVALIEVSPCFRPVEVYAEMVDWIAGCGYDVHVLPEKGDPRSEAFGRDPLGELRLSHRFPSRLDWGLHLERVNQANYVFVRRGLAG